jgi:hypothetical protein
MARQQQQDFGHRLDEHEHRLKFVEQRVRAMEDQAQIHMYDDVDIYHNAYSFHGHRQGQGPVPFM